MAQTADESTLAYLNLKPEQILSTLDGLGLRCDVHLRCHCLVADYLAALQFPHWSRQLKQKLPPAAQASAEYRVGAL